MATETPYRSPEQDDLQALIEEARRRARRRRRGQVVMFAGVTAIVLGCVAVLVPGQSHLRVRQHRAAGVRAAPRPVAGGCLQAVGSFVALAFPDARDGWVVGSPAPAQGPPSPIEVLRTADEGKSWSCQWQARLTATQLVATSRRDAWVLAWQGTGCGDPVASGACKSVVAGTRDGRRWSVLSRPEQRFTQLAFASARAGVAAARTGTCREVNGMPPRRCPGRVMLTSDGGRHWRAALRTRGPIVAVAVSNGTLWAVETRLGLSDKSRPGHKPGLTILVSHDRGRSWSRAGSIDLWLAGPREQVQLLHSRGAPQLWLSVLDLDGCAMHGCSPNDLYVSTSAGRHWQVADARDVKDNFPGLGGCGLAGPIGIGLDPTGGAWSTESLPLAACSGPATVLFHATPPAQSGPPRWMVSHRWAAFEPTAQAWPTPSVGFLLGPDGLTRSTDHGKNWSQVLPAPAPAGPLQATGRSTAYAAQDSTDQGALLGTSDGGQHWQVHARLPGILTRVSFPSPRTGFAAGAVWVPLVGPRWNLYTNAGTTTRWRTLTRLPLRGGQQVAGLWMSSSRNGLMLSSSGFIWPQLQQGVGPATLWRTTDGGKAWTALRHLPVTRDQTVVGSSFTEAGTARWDGWLLVGGAPLRATTNTGKTWQPLPNAPALDGIDHVTGGFGVGWTGPHNGRIKLWQTSDGGKRWQPMPLPTDLPQGRLSNQLPVYESFASPRTGWLIADGYSWHTTSDGRSWQPT